MAMHENEIPSDEALVRALLQAQFPKWAELPIAPPLKTGTDNAIFRLGPELAVRLPRRPASGGIDKAQRWLPQIAPHLPLEVPVALARGEPGAGFPCAWEVVPWVEGRAVVWERLADPVESARAVAEFLRVLQSVDPRGGPLATCRGGALAWQDERVRACVTELGDRVDREAVLASWDASLAAAPLQGPPQWTHADLSPGNLIERGGEVVGAIDFAMLAVGDPACDLLIAWNLFRGESRSALREALGTDDETWARGRGWALYGAVIAMPYYWETNPLLVAQSQRVLRELLVD